MANYNSGILYNAGVKGGGANYNSATYFVVEVSEAGLGEELIQILANMSVSDTGVGAESINVPYKFPAESYFIVTCEGRLNPLGVIVLRDSRYEGVPQTRDNTEEIPGKHGEIDFGSELKARLMELHVATDDGLSPLQKEQLRRTIAGYLNPVAGTKKLVFLDDIDIEYEVKYAGKIDLTKYADWMEFTIPFRMNDPLIASRDEHTQTGVGTIVNDGTFETPILIEIPGPATSPTVSVGAAVIAYTSSIAAGQTLIIDTDTQTAKIGSVNAIAQVSGDIDIMLQPGVDTTIIPSISSTVVKWRNKYL
jgi:predicted phage tail component-like protein